MTPDKDQQFYSQLLDNLNQDIEDLEDIAYYEQFDSIQESQAINLELRRAGFV